MKKRNFLFMLIVAGSVLLTSCNDANNTIATQGEHTKTLDVEHANEPSESMFRIELQSPPTITAGETFEVKGYLVNQSETAWDIFHGADMFTYTIYDDAGKPLPNHEGMISVNDIGLGTTLQPNSKYNYDGEQHVSSKLYQLSVDQPGKYKIVGQAEFYITFDNKSHRFQIQSEPLEVNVDP